MAFDRWVSPWDRSWPFAVFKKHHTQLNELWWSHRCASGRAFSIAKSVGVGNSVVNAFPRAVIDKGRQALPLKEWNSFYSDFDNWVRLSSAVSLCSYFEIYLGKVVTLAIRSDPSVLLRCSKAIDGVILLKKNHVPDTKEKRISVTKGMWSARLASYEAMFSIAPPEFKSQISELDQLQRLRNGFGHTFGRDIDDYDEPIIFSPKPLQRLSEERLMKWMGIVEKAAQSIDKQLRVNHIGAFEVLEGYHLWDKKFPAGTIHEHVAFRSTFPSLQNKLKPAAYFKDAIHFYKKA
jgi:hypothetical protein